MLAAILPSIFTVKAQQAFRPMSPTDSPTSDIIATETDPSLSSSTVYGLHSTTYGLINGIDAGIKITADASGKRMVRGIYFRDGSSDPSMKQIGTIAATITATGGISTIGMMLDNIGMSPGSEISSKVTVRSEHSATGIWINKLSEDQHYIFSGSIDVSTSSTDPYSYNEGIKLTEQSAKTFELKNSSITVSGPNADAFYSEGAIESLVMTGNNRIEAKGSSPETSYAIIAPGTINIYAEAGATQTLVGGIYAWGTSSEGASFKTGSFIMDAIGTHMMIFSQVTNIEKDVQMDCLKTVYFQGHTPASKNVAFIDGKLTLHAATTSSYSCLITQNADITLGENSLLTLMLADGFEYEIGDMLSLVYNEEETDTITGSFADNFMVQYENGTILENQYYSFDGFTLTFLNIFNPVPEPSSSALAGIFALAFALRRRKNTKRGMS